MTLFVKRVLDDGSAEVIGDPNDASYEVTLPRGKVTELSYDRAKVDAWLEESKYSAESKGVTLAEDRPENETDREAATGQR